MPEDYPALTYTSEAVAGAISLTFREPRGAAGDAATVAGEPRESGAGAEGATVTAATTGRAANAGGAGTACTCTVNVCVFLVETGLGG